MKTVVAMFDRFEDAQRAVRELHDAGFRSGDINMIANDATGEYSRQLGTGETMEDISTSGAAAGAGTGAVLGGLGGLLVGLGALAIPGIGPVIAAGPLATALAGAGIGAATGGLVGALTDMGVPEEHSRNFIEGVRRGGVLVSVQTDDMRAGEAADVLNRHNPVDVTRRSTAWTGDPNYDFDRSEPWPADRIEAERRRIMEEENIPVTGSDYHGTYSYDRTGGMGYTGTGDDFTSSGEAYRGTSGVTDVHGSDAAGRGEISGREYRTPGSDYTGTGDVYSEKTGTFHDEEMVDRGDPGEPRPGGLGQMDMSYTGTSYTGTGEQHTGTFGSGDFEGTAGDIDMYDQRFNEHYMSTYGASGRDYTYYQPFYLYGYQLGQSDRYRDYDWDRLEPEARREWESRGEEGVWDDIRDAVRNGWEAITGQRRGY